jgi:adenine-specific DNA-methyltransferase
MIEKPSGDIDKIDLDRVDWCGSREFFESLGEALDKLDDKDESYDFTWVGKRKAIIEAGAPINKTLRPDVESSKNWEATENLFIEGDNLDALKLLQESYLGKVKMIYIDPPYNTGKDFVYHDNFKVSVEKDKEDNQYRDEEGNIQFDYKKNEKTNSRYHSDWLSMMYPRLKLSRNLLSDDGVIFASIGVEEIANLKKLMDEIYGEDNFVEIFSWVKTSTPPALSTKSRKTNEYILCYEKNWSSTKYNGEPLDGGDQPLLNSGNSTRDLRFPAGSILFNRNKFPDGEYNPIKPDRVELINNISIENGRSLNEVVLRGEFKWTQEFLDQEISKGTTFVIKSDALSIRFIRQEEGYKRPTNFIKENIISPVINKKSNGVETNERASSDLKTLMGIDAFDFPKPVSLLSYLADFITKDDDVILDFFSGSATTAHAVIHLNAKDGGSRKWIMVQLPEEVDEKSEAFKSGYKTIPEISRERIRRAGDKIAAEHPEAKVDYGFRALKIADTNYKEVYKSAGEYEQSTLLEVVDNIKDDRTELDLLYGVLTQSAFELNRPLETRDIAGATVYLYDYFGEISGLVACFASSVPEETIKAIATLKPLTAVFRDSSFTDSQAKVNLAEHFRILSPETKVKVI